MCNTHTSSCNMCYTHILHSETRPELEVLLEAQPGFPAHWAGTKAFSQHFLQPQLRAAASSSRRSTRTRTRGGGRRKKAGSPRPQTNRAVLCLQTTRPKTDQFTYKLLQCLETNTKGGTESTAYLRYNKTMGEPFFVHRF